MPDVPPDWNDSKKLWDVLGKAPDKSPSIEFSDGVKQKTSIYSRIPGFNQKVERKASELARMRRWKWMKSSVQKPAPLVSAWMVGVAMATACLVLTWVYLRTPFAPIDNQVSVIRKIASARPIIAPQGETLISVEIIQAIQNYELIQDLEVIEHLSTLNP